MSDVKSKYKVSVIIPTYNRSSLLDYSLLSLLKQDIAKDEFEVVVADDGSFDDTRAVVKEYESLMNIKYVFQEDKGYRPASARNKGIRVAEGHICLFIDSGVILNTNCISTHVKFYEQAGDNAAAIGYVYGFERTKESEEKLKKLVNPHDPAGSIKQLSADEVFFDVRDEHYNTHNDQIHNLPAPWYYYWTCHVSATKKDLLRVGLFDERYDGRWGVEDNDLAFRLVQHEVKIFLLRVAEAIHYPHTKDKDERRNEGYDNCKYFHDKFQTVETGLFLMSYLNEQEFIDINSIRLKMLSKDGNNVKNNIAEGAIYAQPPIENITA